MSVNKTMVLLLVLISMAGKAPAQTWFTKNGQVTFFSKTLLEDIYATNSQVISVIDIQTGVIRFSLLNNAFHFEKAKMEQDFNEDYMESEVYPRSTFNGKITPVSDLDVTRDGTYPVKVTGALQIHGITKNIEIQGVITVKDGKLSAKATFPVLVKEYKIKVPTIVTDKIAEKVEVSISCNYQKK